MTTKVVRGRWVVTGPEESNNVARDAAVVVMGDRIEQIGPWADIRERYPGAEVFGSNDHAIMPGFVNAHHHSNGVPLSLQGIDDDLLEPWILDLKRLRWQDGYLRTLFSAAALLKSGVTSTIDMTNAWGSPETAHEFLKDQVKAYEKAGLRVALAPGTAYRSFLVSGKDEDEAFLNSLPKDLVARIRRVYPLTETLDPKDYFAVVEELHSAYKDHPLVDIWFGPPGPQWITARMYEQIAESAERLDTGIQTHALESFYEKLEGLRSNGVTSIHYFKDLGILSPRFSVAHGVWLTEKEIEIMAETGTGVSHNPSSNLRLRAGIAPLNAFIKAGVTVGLGMDGTTINDAEDMLNEMRLALRLNRTTRLQGPAPSIRDIFHLATRSGARLMRRDHELGTIETGYKADLVVVNLKPVTWPWVADDADPLHLLMLHAKAGDVDMVFVNGEIVVQDGTPTGFDLSEVGSELAASIGAAPENEELKAIIAEIKPRLIDWYIAWEVPRLEPYALLNSRI